MFKFSADFLKGENNKGFTPTPFLKKGVSLQSERGFTLIELLVVIAIIGLLSSVVLASLNGARVKARDAKRLSDRNQIKLALELAYDDNGSYPSGGWYCLGISGSCWRGSYSGNSTVNNILLNYFSSIPLPGATGSGNYATDAYLYEGGGPTLIWYQERQIQVSECPGGGVYNYDAYWYCYEAI